MTDNHTDPRLDRFPTPFYVVYEDRLRRNLDLSPPLPAKPE